MTRQPLRTFGRTKARTLKPRQAALLETLLPRLAVPAEGTIDVEALFPFSLAEKGLEDEGRSTAPASDVLPAPHPPTPSPQGGGGEAPVILEIGFGGGEHLVAQAAAHPQARFIGVEPFLNGVASCLRHIEEKFLLPLNGGGAGNAGGLHSLSHPPTPSAPADDSSPIEGERVSNINIRLHHGDARDVIARLPDASLDLVYILFPDPWPKMRHHKRRLIQPGFVAALARVLKPGAEVRFATDWANYAAWTLWHFTRDARFEWTAERAEDWLTPWPGYTPTRYAQKSLGDVAPVYLRWRRTAA